MKTSTEVTPCLVLRLPDSWISALRSMNPPLCHAPARPLRCWTTHPSATIDAHWTSCRHVKRACPHYHHFSYTPLRCSTTNADLSISGTRSLHVTLSDPLSQPCVHFRTQTTHFASSCASTHRRRRRRPSRTSLFHASASTATRHPHSRRALYLGAIQSFTSLVPRRAAVPAAPAYIIAMTDLQPDQDCAAQRAPSLRSFYLRQIRHLLRFISRCRVSRRIHAWLHGQYACILRIASAKVRVLLFVMLTFIKPADSAVLRFCVEAPTFAAALFDGTAVFFLRPILRMRRKMLFNSSFCIW